MVQVEIHTYCNINIIFTHTNTYSANNGGFSVNKSIAEYRNNFRENLRNYTIKDNDNVIMRRPPSLLDKMKKRSNTQLGNYITQTNHTINELNLSKE